MARDTIAFLDTLTCRTDATPFGGLSPYIWPALVVVDDRTLRSSGLVSVTMAPPDTARSVISRNIRPGQTVSIPACLNRIQARIEDDGSIQTAILVLVMFTECETPKSAVTAGYRAFSPALRESIARRLLQLREANALADATDRAAAMNAFAQQISREVQDAVSQKVRDALCPSDQIRARQGTLKVDEMVGMDWLMADPVTPRNFRFLLEKYNPGAHEPAAVFDLAGAIQVRPASSVLKPFRRVANFGQSATNASGNGPGFAEERTTAEICRPKFS